MQIVNDIRSAWRENGVGYLIHSSPGYLRDKTIKTLQRNLYNPYGVVDREQLKQICENTTSIWYYGTETDCEITPPLTGELPDRYQSLIGSYTIPPSFVCELPHVWLFGDRAISRLESGKYILEEMGTESIHQSHLVEEFNQLPLRKRLQEIRRPTSDGSPTTYDTVINLVPRHGGSHNDFINYGHWITEDLPRLRAYEEYHANTGRKPALLIKKDPPSWMTDTLQLLGFSPSDWIEWDGTEATVSRLVIPKLSYVHSVGAEFQPADRAWVSREMKSRIEMEETEQFPERVFISRQGQERRKILNFDEMMDVLSTFGFEAIRPEELSIEDQIRLFDQAETIVGASGSGLASIVFSDAASLIEIKPHDADITVWHILTTERGLQYDCLSGSGPEHRSNDMNRNTDICVDTETLAETISQHI